MLSHGLTKVHPRGQKDLLKYWPEKNGVDDFKAERKEQSRPSSLDWLPPPISDAFYLKNSRQ